jgi:hypothetical protein
MRLGARLENGGSKRGCNPPPIRPFSNQARVSRNRGMSIEVSLEYRYNYSVAIELA